MNEFDFAKFADTMDEFHETLRAMVAGLVSEGFTDEQARAMVTAIVTSKTEPEPEVRTRRRLCDAEPMPINLWPGVPPCPCACNSGGFCGGCGHAGCGGRR